MDVLIDAVSFQQSQSAQHSSTAPYDDSYATASTPQLLDPGNRSPSSQFRPQTSQAGSPHRCHLCGRTYERADHLNRHLKSHENARPYKCSRCAKSFNRADLLNRHEASHDKHANGDSRPRIQRGERVAAACKACVSSKSKCQERSVSSRGPPPTDFVKCQERKPCPRCVKKGLVCEDGGARQSKPHQGLSPSIRRDSRARDSPAIDRARQAHSSTGAGPPPPNQQQPSTPVVQQNFNPPGTPGTGYYEHFASAANTFDVSGPSSKLGYLASDLQYSQESDFTPRDAYFSQDFDLALWDFDLNSIELAYQLENPQTIATAVSSEHAPRSSQNDTSKRVAAFERSPWLFNPTQKDHRMNDQENIDVDEDNLTASTASPAATIEDFSSCCINSKIRDDLLELIFTMPNQPRKVPSLPSLALLNNIIQVYFVQESFFVDHLLHAASFDPRKSLPHLVLAILARGATFISVPAIWKMGLALEGLVHYTVGELFESNNSNTRDLQAVQSFVIGLDIALWSGINRKMEIAEAFGHTIAVILRRSGSFAAPRSSSVFVPKQNDSNSVLESKWRNWAEMESWKRLVLHFFMNDVHTSVGLQKPPQISFTELRFALPASRELWTAKSATDWRDRYLSASIVPSTPSTPSNSSASSLPTTTSLLEAMHTPDLLIHQSAHIDVQFSALAILHGFWGQIWGFWETKKFYPPNKATHRLSLLTSHTELTRDLVAYANLLPSLTRNSAEATLIAETLLMVLHVLPEDLQRFAGKHGELEAQIASTELAEWSKTTESRTAVWHAGQAFHAASQLENARLKGFNAIALYYASLTLWVYGLMTSSSPLGRQDGLISRFSKDRIVLNEPEAPSTRSWRFYNEGSPGIRILSRDGTNELFSPLGGTDQILQLARNVYKNNFSHENAESMGSLPPLVENLRHLLRDLGDTPGSRVSTRNSEGVA